MGFPDYRSSPGGEQSDSFPAHVEAADWRRHVAAGALRTPPSCLFARMALD